MFRVHIFIVFFKVMLTFDRDEMILSEFILFTMVLCFLNNWMILITINLNDLILINFICVLLVALLFVIYIM